MSYRRTAESVMSRVALAAMDDADAPVIGVDMHDAVIVCVYGADPAWSQFALALKLLHLGILAAPRWV